MTNAFDLNNNRDFDGHAIGTLNRESSDGILQGNTLCPMVTLKVRLLLDAIPVGTSQPQTFLVNHLNTRTHYHGIFLKQHRTSQTLFVYFDSSVLVYTFPSL